MLTIRNAQLDDLVYITAIYNEAIISTTATFDTQTKSIKEMKSWFKNHDSKNPIIVAENNKIIVGWAALSRWSDRCAYSDTAEISLYVKNEFKDRGIGKKLIESIIRKGESVGLHVIIAQITEGNKNSIHLHESIGFEHIGKMKEVGKKFGELLDVYLMQKTLKNK
jgi:phosphinothricin acetyltransferase